MSNKTSRLTPLAFALLALGATASQTAHADDSAFNFSGFATLGLTSTNTDQAKYVVYGEERGATKDISADVDSKIGLQATGKLNSMFSATVQVLAKQAGDGDFRPGFEWAFAKAQLTPEFSVRVGRMGAPFFAVSDFRDVGYANTWVRPPIDVYGQVPVSHFDGADAIYQANVGSTTLTAQLYGGKSNANVTGNAVTFQHLYGLNLTAELDNGLTLRLGRADGYVSVNSASLSQLVQVLETTPFASVGDQLSAQDKPASFTGFGVSYDQNNIVVSSEYTRRHTDSYVPSTTGWYLTGGYRFGKVLPYVTVSQLKVDSSNVNNTIPVGVNAALTTLKYTVDGALANAATQQKTVAIGVRWDLWRSAALKAQIDRIKPNGPGLFQDPQPGFGTGQSVNVYSLAVDTVF